MDKFLSLAKKDRNAAFKKANVVIGLSEDILEKDFWVCWTLKELFLIDELKDYLTFKGGTSLSKVYSVIERFSEDIDISIERSFLGFEGDTEPENVSKKKAKKLIEELNIECKKYVKSNLLNQLQSLFDKKLIDLGDWKLEIDDNDNDGQTILFYYPKVTTGESPYIKPMVKIEIGARSDHWPVSMREISPYIIEVLPQDFKDMKAQIRVLNLERTFWEKATILHVFANFPEDRSISERQSRHYYDFYCLLKSEAYEKAVSDLALLEKVVEHKKLYFRSGWADYDMARKGTLKIIPSEKVLKEMEKDYSAMKEMFFSESPSWEDIVYALKEFQIKFNEG